MEDDLKEDNISALYYQIFDTLMEDDLQKDNFFAHYCTSIMLDTLMEDDLQEENFSAHFYKIFDILMENYLFCAKWYYFLQRRPARRQFICNLLSHS